MKTCPYCAEEIPEEATKCRYCRSDLTVPPGSTPTPAPAAPAVGQGALRFTHSGDRYILGYGKDFFGIWDRQAPGPASFTFPRSDDGWTEAWHRYSAWEPRAITVQMEAGPAPDLRQGSYRPYRSSVGRARWVVGLMWAVAGFAFLQIVALFKQIGVLERVRAGKFVTTEELQQSDGFVAFAGGLGGILFLVAGILWLMWQHRAHSNLRALGAADVHYSPGWAVGWWFIPFANLVAPFRVNREAWKASNPDAGATDWQAEKTPALIGWWWATYLVANVAAVEVRVGREALTASDLIVLNWRLIFAAVVLIIATYLGTTLVRRITARQEEKRLRNAERAQAAMVAR